MLAAAYAGLGKLALSWALPPGAASPIFPSSGLALGAILIGGWRLLPAVWLGSVLLNAVWAPTPVAVEFAILIGLGATLQAAAGRALLSATGNLPLALDEERALFRFFLLAAGVSALISPTLGISALYLAGLLTPAELAPNWAAWWLGDALGVLLFTPLLLMAVGQPREQWRPQLYRVAPVVLLCFAGVLGLFHRVSTWEEQRIALQFRERGEHIGQALRDRSQAVVRAVHYLERFFAASDTIGQAEFAEFAQFNLREFPELKAAALLQRVPAGERAAHEAAMRATGQPSYRIREIGPDGALRPAGVRDVYFPAVMVVPATGNRTVLGLDAGSEPTRRANLLRAERGNGLAVSDPVRLVQPQLQRQGLLLVLGVNTRSGATKGWVSVALAIDELVTEALAGQPLSDLGLRLHARRGDAAPIELYTHGRAAGVDDDSEPLRHAMRWAIGDQEWQLDVIADPAYRTLHRSSQAWLLLLAGMLFSGLLGAQFMLAAGRNTREERLVRERTAALARSESTLRAVSAAAPDAILLLDAEGRIRSANPASHRLLGIGTDADLVGRALAEWLPDCELATLLRDAAARESGYRGEWLLRRSDGSRVPAELTLSPLRLPDRDLTSAMLRDLSERYALDRMKSEFIATVSHELRTPLTSIRGALGLLRNAGLSALPAPAAELIAVGDRNAERLGRLIDDLLDFERLELGTTPIPLLAQPLTPLISQAVRDIAPFAQAQDVRLAFDDRLPDGCQVAVAADRFVQALSNLLSNAIKFSPRGGTVTVRSMLHDGQVRTEVEDQGEGIPEALQPLVFTRFWQADSSARRRHGGTGLGLAISRLLVERMGGRIWFESRPDEGTRFGIELPLVRAEAATDPVD